MCGIAGAVDPDHERARSRVALLNRLQAHRGPDHAAVVTSCDVTLGNTRLAIQDPTPQGNQPFRSADGNVVIVFNGEIYNYRELRARFGLHPGSDCDGAILPELWQLLGSSCLPLLRGMYALAVADAISGELTLVRDPFGIKPLYWRRLPDRTVLFASEPRALAAVGPRPAVSGEAVASFLHLGALGADMAPFEGVRGVPPNRFLVFARGRNPVTHTIMADDQAVPSVSRADMADAFQESVHLHLRSDVPTTLLLSDGVDSAAIALAAQRAGKQLNCLTLAPAGGLDESGNAEATAVRYRHPHTVVRPRLDEDGRTTFFRAMQRPTVDGLNTFLVCQAVRESGFKVALTGIGGDEILGGYRHFKVLRALRALDAVDRLPQPAVNGALRAAARRWPGLRREKVRRLVSRGGPRDAWALSLLQREVLPPAVVAALTGLTPPVPPRPPGATIGSRSPTALTRAEVGLYLQRTLLPDADAFSMCWSVELRVPFVDWPFVQAAMSARGAARPGKAWFVRALRDVRLREVAARPKRGFSVPMASWMDDGPLSPLVTALNEREAPIWTLLDRCAARALWQESRNRNRWVEVWTLAALDGWLRSLGTDGEGQL